MLYWGMVQSLLPLFSHRVWLSNFFLQLLETHNNLISTFNVDAESIHGSDIKSQNHLKMRIDKRKDLSIGTNKYEFIYSLEPHQIVFDQIDYIYYRSISRITILKRNFHIPSRIIILIFQSVTIMSSGTRKFAIQQNNATGINIIAPVAFYYSTAEECFEEDSTYVNDGSDNFIFYCPSTSTRNNRYSLFGHQCAGIKLHPLASFIKLQGSSIKYESSRYDSYIRSFRFTKTNCSITGECNNIPST